MNEQMVKGAPPPNGDFALGFQPDGVQLLHRHGNAWAELGKAQFNADLRDGLGDFVQQLRAANAPAVSLVIPDEQILYTALVLPAAADTQAALKAGLDGRTPYRVDELAFDYAPADAKPGATVKVAAVWRQTLQEAEDFAVRHGFAPDRFVAAPPEGQFPRAPDFGATGLAAEWAHASADLDLSDETGTDTPASAQAETMKAAIETPAVAVKTQEPTAPVLSRITPHVVLTATPEAAPAPVSASVNSGSIVLPGEVRPDADPDEPATDSVVEAKADPGADATDDAEPAPRPLKPLPERARAFHERASEARKARPAPAAGTRPVAQGGRRSGLGGALPLVGILVLGLGISAALIGREEAETPAEPMATQTAVEPTEPQEAPQVVTADPAPVDAPASQAATQATPATDIALPENIAPLDAGQQGVDPQTAEAVPSAAPTNSDASVQTAPADSVASATEPTVIPADSPMAAAIAAAYATAQPLTDEPAPQPPAAAPQVEEAPAAAAEAAAPVRPAPTQSRAAPDVASSARPPSRPQNLVRSSAAAQQAPAAAEQSRPAAQSSAPASRPASRPAAPAASTQASAPATARSNPGAPDSATLVSSARPKTAPSRSEPAAAAPDARPAVPRSPQPYEQRQQPEPSSARPPPKPLTQSSVDGAVLQSQPAPRHFALFSVRGQAAVLAQMDRPWIALVAPELRAPVRTAEARPVRRPVMNDASASAVDAAVSEAIGGAARPAARASTAAPATATAAAVPASGDVVALKRSARPAHRPGNASTAGISESTDSAVEAAIASAVSSSAAVPGRVALLPLTSSARPSWRGNRSGGADAPAASGGGTGAEGTLAPEPEQNAGQSQAEAEAAALAERRSLDEELQRQAEQRIRERAASDARAAAQAKAAAEARARAQAEAEAAAAARRNQRYRPPEVDNEPEVASAERAPASGAVAGSATTKGIDLNATQLIGTVGAGKASRGLIRLRNGRIVTVRLGDKINGGQISSIGNGGLKYVKAGREYSLPILNGR